MENLKPSAKTALAHCFVELRQVKRERDQLRCELESLRRQRLDSEPGAGSDRRELQEAA